MFKWFSRALKVMKLLGETVPNSIKDGKLSIEESVVIVQKLFEIFEADVINIPQDIADKYVNIVSKIPMDELLDE